MASGVLMRLRFLVYGAGFYWSFDLDTQVSGVSVESKLYHICCRLYFGVC